ncbi:brachyurin-like [Chrysoperla carnea]|uniref:brachyurin-like n=1 Tax=Chrysoperla carnea TaxID=189513 RepID=UPI001D065443|nr:brachyurin-like [Chrysoperla carnea]
MNFRKLLKAYEFEWQNVRSPINIDSTINEELGSFHSQKSHHGRVVGGNEVIPHKYPYQAGILLKLGERTGFCGGSLISKRCVLTAAHCAQGVSNFTVILGAHNIEKNEPTQQIFYTTEKIVHPKWLNNGKQFKMTNDIALIFLPKDAELNENVQVIRLPARSQVNEKFVSVEATVTGWGKSTDATTNPVTPVLRETSNEIISNERCNGPMLGVIEDSQLCLSGKNGRGSCMGDSGGPLVITEDDGNFTQIGVISFGMSIGCEKNLPTAYTRLTSFLDFIRNNSDVEIRDK